MFLATITCKDISLKHPSFTAANSHIYLRTLFQLSHCKKERKKKKKTGKKLKAEFSSQFGS